jgi:hypothetical protein
MEPDDRHGGIAQICGCSSITKHPMRIPSENRLFVRRGTYLSAAVSTLTLITFVFAMIAVPPSGPMCPGDCIYYPYQDSLRQYPRDYIWLYIALFQVVVFLVFQVFLHQSAKKEQKLFSLSGLLTGGIASGILFLTYYVQAAVVPISLMKEEYDGIALLTMYNDHGIFIAQEEIAYLLMALSLFLFSWIFTGKGTRVTGLKWLFRIPLMVSLVAIVIISFMYGPDRSYRFEIVTISANWLVLIVAGYSMIGWVKSTLSESR